MNHFGVEMDELYRACLGLMAHLNTLQQATENPEKRQALYESKVHLVNLFDQIARGIVTTTAEHLLREGG